MDFGVRRTCFSAPAPLMTDLGFWMSPSKASPSVLTVKGGYRHLHQDLVRVQGEKMCSDLSVVQPVPPSLFPTFSALSYPQTHHPLPSSLSLPSPFPLPTPTPWAVAFFLVYPQSIPGLPGEGHTSHVIPVSVPTYPFFLLVKSFKVLSI